MIKKKIPRVVSLTHRKYQSAKCPKAIQMHNFMPRFSAVSNIASVAIFWYKVHFLNSSKVSLCSMPHTGMPQRDGAGGDKHHRTGF